MIKYNKEAEKLADFIEANPHCKFDIDNDSWYIMKPIEGNKTDLRTGICARFNGANTLL